MYIGESLSFSEVKFKWVFAKTMGQIGVKVVSVSFLLVNVFDRYLGELGIIYGSSNIGQVKTNNEGVNLSDALPSVLVLYSLTLGTFCIKESFFNQFDYVF